MTVENQAHATQSPQLNVLTTPYPPKVQINEFQTNKQIENEQADSMSAFGARATQR